MSRLAADIEAERDVPERHPHREARRFAREPGHGSAADVIDAIELMVSELVANGIRHTGPGRRRRVAPRDWRRTGRARQPHRALPLLLHGHPWPAPRWSHVSTSGRVERRPAHRGGGSFGRRSAARSAPVPAALARDLGHVPARARSICSRSPDQGTGARADRPGTASRAATARPIFCSRSWWHCDATPPNEPSPRLE